MTEVQDIFRLYGEKYRQKHKLSTPLIKTMSAIESCRTKRLGAHVTICEDCGNTRISYNSCRNRHCPKCQFLAKERWIANQSYNLLNTNYFHVVFTVPDTLNTLIFQNQRECYNLLFKASSETLLELSGDEKYLGAKIGFSSILHTWGSNLSFHPHIHSIVTGGGLNSLDNWISGRQKFFLPVKVLSKLFRGKFLALLSQAELSFYGKISYLNNSTDFQRFLTSLYIKDWIVYCKAPFKHAHAVVNYLGRYTHRIAISNSRIVSILGDRISFKWKDYRDSSKWKIMTLSAEEFIRRFLMHVLPFRFMKIRHYGLLANRDKEKRLTLCKRLTKTKLQEKKKLSTKELIMKLTKTDISRCSACGSKRLKEQAFIDDG